MNELERETRRRWLAGATHVHYGRCDSCKRLRDDDDHPLLVARQPRRRAFECVECFDRREARR